MKAEPSSLDSRLIRYTSTTLLVLGILIAFAYCLHRLSVLWLENNPTDQSQLLANSTTSNLPLFPIANAQEVSTELTKLRIEQKAQSQLRKIKINRVEAFLTSYGSELKGYGHIIVDQAAKCGGDYKVLIGIAGSESGLGRIMYKKYNPYGYLDGVQYKSQAEALNILTCKISQQHLSPCNNDIACVAKRYAGPKDDLSHFISKVRWFMDQV